MKKNGKVIVFVINTLQIGGAAKILKFVIEKSNHLFEKVFLITLDNDDKIYFGNNVSHIRINFRRDKMKKGIWRLKVIKEIRKIVSDIDPNIVCSFISDVAVTTRLATIGKKCIFVSAERGDPYTLPRLWKLLVKLTYSLSDYCIFQTKMARDFFNKKIVKKSFIIPNPYIKLNEVLPYYGERKKTIVSAGRFSSEKCFDLLIRAFSKVHKDHPEYRLIIYGDGPERQSYAKLIKELELDNYVSLPGYVKNIPEHIREQGIFVLSSRYEGIPNALIEAMSMGLPTISTDCTPGGPRFLTDNGNRGVLIPVNNIDAMVLAINKLIDYPEIAETYSERTKEILSILDADTIATQWINTFKRIIG